MSTTSTPNHNLTPAEQFKVLKEIRKAQKDERRHRQAAAKISLEAEDSARSSSNASRNSHTTNEVAVIVKEEQEEQEEQIKSPRTMKNTKFPKMSEASDKTGFKKPDSRLNLFHKRLEELKAYKQRHGHLRIPQKVDKALHHYCYNMRKLRKKGTLGAEMIEALDKLGFEWNVTTSARNFDKRLEALKAYKQKYGHLRVAQRVDQSLHRYCYNMKKLRIQGSVGAEMIEDLDKLGFDWNIATSEIAFDERLEALKAYKQKYGHLRVSQRANPSLYRCSYEIRKSRKNGTLEAEKIEALDKLGFEWNVITCVRGFDERLEALKAYKQKHGHLRVSVKVDKSLYRFCYHLKKLRIQGSLEAEIIEALDKIGFEWNIATSEVAFDKRLEELKPHKQKHGHFRVCKRVNPSLYRYFYEIRKSRKNGTLEAEKIEALDKLGFEWDIGTGEIKSFDEVLEKLKAYKQQHGHLRV